METNTPDFIEEKSENIINSASSSPVDDGSLLQLYESRLRRLRDYESRVRTKYSATQSTVEAEAWRSSGLEGPQSNVDGHYQPSEQQPTQQPEAAAVQLTTDEVRILADAAESFIITNTKVLTPSDLENAE